MRCLTSQKNEDLELPIRYEQMKNNWRGHGVVCGIVAAPLYDGHVAGKLYDAGVRVSVFKEEITR